MYRCGLGKYLLQADTQDTLCTRRSERRSVRNAFFVLSLSLSSPMKMGNAIYIYIYILKMIRALMMGKRCGVESTIQFIFASVLRHLNLFLLLLEHCFT